SADLTIRVGLSGHGLVCLSFRLNRDQLVRIEAVSDNASLARSGSADIQPTRSGEACFSVGSRSSRGRNDEIGAVSFSPADGPVDAERALGIGRHKEAFMIGPAFRSAAGVTYQKTHALIRSEAIT